MTVTDGVGVVIRVAGAADVQALARLRYEFRAALHAPVEEEQPFLARCAPWMADRLASLGAWRCWIAEESAAPLGSVWLQLLEKIPNPVGEPELHGYVTSLYVRTDRRGEGIGSGLLAASLVECESRGADSAFLWPTPNSRPLYERHGFSVCGDMLERRLERLPADATR